MAWLALGTVQFGMEYGIQRGGRPDVDAACAMMERAVSRGVAAFDTAAAYGDAESVVGAFSRAHPDMLARTSIISKLAPGVIKPDMTRAEMERAALSAAEGSLSRIGASRLAAYLFHDSDMIFNDDAVAALCSVKSHGLTDAIGVSTYTPQQASRALSLDCVGAVQVPYCALDRRLDRAGIFDEAERRGVTIYARSSLLQGLLAMEPDALPEKMAFAAPYLARFREICARHGASPLEAALWHAASRRGIDFVVFGVDRMEQLDGYIDVFTTAPNEALLRDIAASFDDVPDRVVRPDLW